MDDYLKYQCDYYYKEPEYCFSCETYYTNKCSCNQLIKFLREKKADIFALFKKKDPDLPF